MKHVRVLAIMSKAPTLGRCKTRLTRFGHVSADQAAKLATAFLLDTLSHASQIPYTEVIIVTPRHDADALSALLSNTTFRSTPVFAQGGKGLLPGLDWSFRMLEKKGFASIATIMNDTPSLPRDHLELAFRSLEKADIVLGPTQDGRCWIIAAHRNIPELFTIPLSTPRGVYRKRIETASALGFSVHTLSSWFDVDYWEDLIRLGRELAGNPGSAPYTWDVLQELFPQLVHIEINH